MRCRLATPVVDPELPAPCEHSAAVVCVRLRPQGESREPRRPTDCRPRRPVARIPPPVGCGEVDHQRPVGGEVAALLIDAAVKPRPPFDMVIREIDGDHLDPPGGSPSKDITERRGAAYIKMQ